MAGNFFRGTTVEQDGRWGKSDERLMAKMSKAGKFSPILEKKVDMKKVNLEIISKWVSEKITSVLGFEDDIISNLVINLLQNEKLEGKKLQLDVTGFLDKHAGSFVSELWGLLLDAQDQPMGVPSVFIQQKKEEILTRQSRDAARVEAVKSAAAAINTLGSTADQKEVRNLDEGRDASSTKQNHLEAIADEGYRRHRERDVSPSPIRRRRRRSPSRSPSPDHRSNRRRNSSEDDAEADIKKDETNDNNDENRVRSKEEEDEGRRSRSRRSRSRSDGSAPRARRHRSSRDEDREYSRYGSGYNSYRSGRRGGGNDEGRYSSTNFSSRSRYDDRNGDRARDRSDRDRGDRDRERPREERDRRDRDRREEREGSRERERDRDGREVSRRRDRSNSRDRDSEAEPNDADKSANLKGEQLDKSNDAIKSENENEASSDESRHRHSKHHKKAKKSHHHHRSHKHSRHHRRNHSDSENEKRKDDDHDDGRAHADDSDDNNRHSSSRHHLKSSREEESN